MTRDAPDFRTLTDGDLLEAAAGGSQLAFAELVNRHYQPVYRLAWRVAGDATAAEDLTQEAFIKLWRDPRQVRDAAALKGWLMRVASNAAIDRARKPASRPLEDAPDTADPQARPDAPLARAQAAQLVDEALAHLPGRQRQALALVYFEGMSNGEAAAVMDVGVEAVESLLARARRSLKERLAGQWRALLDGLTETGM